MINNNRLHVFESFQIDKTLLKYTSKQSTKDPRFLVNEGSFPQVIDGNAFFVKKKNFFQKWFNRKSKVKPPKEINLKTIEQFFKEVFSSVSELEDVSDIIKHYDRVIENAKATGQQSLIETVQDKINMIRLESILIGKECSKYIEEEQIIKFYQATRKASRNETKVLKLSWIKNYTRIIPNEVIQVKKRVDKFKVFDNYVLLHFDPKNQAAEMTKEEKKKAADPILFGVIEDSNRLYYIADWTDEYCDITLDKLLTTIDEKSFEITNESVKTIIK